MADPESYIIRPWSPGRETTVDLGPTDLTLVHAVTLLNSVASDPDTVLESLEVTFTAGGSLQLDRAEDLLVREDVARIQHVLQHCRFEDGSELFLSLSAEGIKGVTVGVRAKSPALEASRRVDSAYRAMGLTARGARQDAELRLFVGALLVLGLNVPPYVIPVSFGAPPWLAGLIMVVIGGVGSWFAVPWAFGWIRRHLPHWLVRESPSTLLPPRRFALLGAIAFAVLAFGNTAVLVA